MRYTDLGVGHAQTRRSKPLCDYRRFDQGGDGLTATDGDEDDEQEELPPPDGWDESEYDSTSDDSDSRSGSDEQ